MERPRRPVRAEGQTHRPRLKRHNLSHSELDEVQLGRKFNRSSQKWLQLVEVMKPGNLSDFTSSVISPISPE